MNYYCLPYRLTGTAGSCLIGTSATSLSQEEGFSLCGDSERRGRSREMLTASSFPEVSPAGCWGLTGTYRPCQHCTQKSNQIHLQFNSTPWSHWSLPLIAQKETQASLGSDPAFPSTSLLTPHCLVKLLVDCQAALFYAGDLHGAWGYHVPRSP